LFAAATDPNNALSFAQYGVLGLIVIGFVTRKIVSGELLERAEAKIAEKDAQIDRMRLAMEEKTVPALIRCTEALVDATEVLANRRRPPAKS
jgi:hypothetical protein